MNDNLDLDAAIAEIKVKTSQVQATIAKIRGTGTAGNGTITAIVDSAGHLRDLKLTRDATRWGDRLASMILQATADAERDAAAKVQKAMRPLTHDPRFQAGAEAIREAFGQVDPVSQLPKAMTEDEIQAADDAYFERMNQRGWST